jgi:hypothetical protein
MQDEVDTTLGTILRVRPGYHPQNEGKCSVDFLEKIDPGDQILLKNSKCSESLQIKRERRPHRYEPNATRLGSNGRREREISRSVQNDKQAKKGMLTVQSVQSVRMLTWQSVRHVAGLSGRQLADVDE